MNIAKKILGLRESDDGAWHRAIDAMIDANKPISVTLGPESLKTIRYFLEKPHHETAQRQMHRMLRGALELDPPDDDDIDPDLAAEQERLLQAEEAAEIERRNEKSNYGNQGPDEGEANTK